MRHFLDLESWTSAELMELLDVAVSLKAEWQDGGNKPLLAGQTLGMIFQKPSLRTRVSFDVGMQHLGGHAIMLGPQEIQLGERESVADVSRVMSGYVQAIMARVFKHSDLLELARHASVPVINGLSDDSHPCQALADMLTIYEHFGNIKGLKVAYVGDGNNVAASLLMASAQLGANFAISTPAGMGLPEDVFQRAVEAPSEPVKIEVFRDPAKAVAGADVIYTDTWISMGQEDQRDEKLGHFAGYQVNEALLQKAPDHAVVLHCLPAHRGEEITDAVADSDQSLIFPQAHNRLHAQKAILVKLMS
jgi:ornithine carbamoyltransferase